MSRALPPGQIETTRLPVVGERASSGVDQDSYVVEVVGAVDESIELPFNWFLENGERTLTFDIHCVTSWSRLGASFVGLPLSEVLSEASVSERARFVSFEAHSAREHHTSLSLDVALRDTWVVHSFEGEPLSEEHGGPLRTVTPGRYFYKSLKWLRRIVLLEHDRLGWWETNSAYHNNAEPWSGKERFTTGSLRPGQLQRFLQAQSYAKYREKVLLGLDLREWSPPTSDLRRLHLKNCDLRGVALDGADLSYSNLSLSDLRGASLRSAKLAGADLEGVNFVGADLATADLSHTALSAARFADETGAANISGALFEGAWGLTESQEEFVSEGRSAPEDDPRPR